MKKSQIISLIIDKAPGTEWRQAIWKWLSDKADAIDSRFDNVSDVKLKMNAKQSMDMR